MMAATLNDIVDPIGDCTIVLTLLFSVSGRFRPMVTSIKSQKSLPTFAKACTMLLLEEFDIDVVIADTDTPPGPTPSALVTDTPSIGSRGHFGRGP
jgi:hypothetical protein